MLNICDHASSLRSHSNMSVTWHSEPYWTGLSPSNKFMLLFVWQDGLLTTEDSINLKANLHQKPFRSETAQVVCAAVIYVVRPSVAAKRLHDGNHTGAFSRKRPPSNPTNFAMFDFTPANPQKGTSGAFCLLGDGRVVPGMGSVTQTLSICLSDRSYNRAKVQGPHSTNI